VNSKPSLRRSQELPGPGGLRCGFGGSLGCGAFAFDAIFATEQSSCTAIPYSSIAQDSSETATPHIQQVNGGSEPDTTMRLQWAPIDPSAPAHGRTEEMLLRRAGGCLLAGAHFCLSHLESGQGVSAILKLRSVFGNTHIRAVRFRSQLNFSPTNRAAIMRVLIAEDDAALADFVRQGLREGSIMRWTWWKIGSRRAPRKQVRLRVGDFGLEPAGARRSEWVTSFAAEVEDRGAVS